VHDDITILTGLIVAVAALLTAATPLVKEFRKKRRKR
jgi:hypothetical protein